MKLRISCLALLLLSPASPGQAVGEIPSGLAKALDEYGCSKITDRTEFANFRGRWWIPLKQYTGADTDFVFFCHYKLDRLSTSLVVHVRGATNPWTGCRQTVTTWTERRKAYLPVDLEVVAIATRYPRITDLARWWTVDSSDNPQVTHGPTGESVSHLIIDTTGQSAGSLFACFAYEWYRIGID